MKFIIKSYWLMRCWSMAANGSRLCEAVDFGKQKFNNIQKFNR